MKNEIVKIIVVTVILAAVAVTLSRVIWPDPLEFIPPSKGQMPFFQFLGFVEALAFGFGVSFLVFGWKHARDAFEDRKASARFAFFSTGWLLVSWWFHDNIHRVTAEGDYTSLLLIEYGFHLTLMIAGFAVAYFLWDLYRERITQLPKPHERTGPPF